MGGAGLETRSRRAEGSHALRTDFYVKTSLDHIFTSGLMVPFDFQKLAETFLKPTQHLLWQADWERRVEAAVSENLRLPQGDPRQFATLDMMLRKGHFADPQAQARLHTAILQQFCNAREVFHAVPDMRLPAPSYTSG